MTASMSMPLDVKLMNITASVLFAVFFVMLSVAGIWWMLRHPVFGIAGITVQGDVTHNSAVTLRANVAPKLAGNFFTVSLAAASDAFEAVPWVRRAVVRREFPNRLRVALEEHRAAAYWGTDGEGRLINIFGEVFEANPGDVEAEELPRLSGPQGQSAVVLTMYHTLKPIFEKLDLGLEQLTLSARGSWQLQLDNNAVVELGRGTPEEVVARTQRFVQTLTQAASRYGRRPDALVSADLRHEEGYALRLRGVGTTGVEVKNK